MSPPPLSVNKMPYLSGSCACGKITFDIDGTPHMVCNCYCRECRKCSGSPYISFFHVKFDSVNFNLIPEEWVSSKTASRGLCRECGTNLYMIYGSDTTQIAIATGTIDQGFEHIPQAGNCIFCEEMPPGTELPSGWPAYMKWTSGEKYSPASAVAKQKNDKPQTQNLTGAYGSQGPPPVSEASKTEQDEYAQKPAGTAAA